MKRGAVLVGDDEQIVRLPIVLLHDALSSSSSSSIFRHV
jgi:hypothetical protein